MVNQYSLFDEGFIEESTDWDETDELLNELLLPTENDSETDDDLNDPNEYMMIEPAPNTIIFHGSLHPVSFDMITQQKPSTKETAYRDESIAYATEIATLPTFKSGSQLDETIPFLKYAPLLKTVTRLGRTLADPQETVPATLLTQARDNKVLFDTIHRPESHISRLLSEPLNHLTIQRFDPDTQTADDLDEMLGSTLACTYSKNQWVRDDISPAHLYYEDARRGGSLHYLVHNNPKRQTEIDLDMNEYRICEGNTYTRLYLGMDKHDLPFLFLDCIEAGNVSWQNIEDYLKNDVQDGLLGSLVTAIHFAQQLGIDRLALGESETIEVVQALGGKEQRYFTKNENNHEQKLGLCGSDSYTDGAYMWRMNSSRSFYTLDTTILQPSVLDTVYADMRAIAERTKKYPKTKKTLKESYTIYQDHLSMLEPLFSTYDPSYSQALENFSDTLY